MLPNYSHLFKALKNILLCNWHRFQGKSLYPQSIIPKLCYVGLIDIDTLIKKQQLYLVRRSNKPFNETFYNLGDELFLREDALDNKEIPRLSLNLLGGKFKTQHIKFRTGLKAEASKPWDGVSLIFLSDHLKDFKALNEDLCPIFFDANNIHNQKVPYNREKNRDLERDINRFFEKVIAPTFEHEGKYVLSSQTRVTHDPTNLNYWHIEYNLYDYQNKIIIAKKGAWIEEVCNKVIKDLLSVNAYPECPKLTLIPKSVYKKTA